MLPFQAKQNLALTYIFQLQFYHKKCYRTRKYSILSINFGKNPFFVIILIQNKNYCSIWKMPFQDYSSLADAELICKYRENGDQKAFTTLVNRHLQLVFTVCNKFLNSQESHDASLEIFERLISLLKHHEIANFKSWLCVVTKNHCLMIKRQIERYPIQLFDPIEFEKNFMENYENCTPNYIELIKPEEVQHALEQLKESQKRCLQYFYYSKKTYKEISSLTGFDVKQVKSYIQNGKRNLKNILTKKQKNSSWSIK